MPPLWFVGLYEVGGGHVIDDLPRTGLPRRLVPFDRESTAVYRSRREQFGELAWIAAGAMTAVSLLAAGFYTWNNRALPPSLAPRRNSAHHIRRVFLKVVERILVRDPLRRAGFFFSLQTLWRNAAHRLSMTIAAAVG